MIEGNAKQPVEGGGMVEVTIRIPADWMPHVEQMAVQTFRGWDGIWFKQIMGKISIAAQNAGLAAADDSAKAPLEDEDRVRLQRSGSASSELEHHVESGESSGLVGVGGVVEWLRSKLAEAEQALRAREQMVQCLRGGTNASWDAAAKMHPSTANAPRMTKADRLRDASAQERIAVRCRRDVEMFKTLLASLGGGGAEQVTEDSRRHEGETPNDLSSATANEARPNV